MLVPLILVPYLTRALGAEAFGLVAFGQGFVWFFMVLIDWGFNQAATRAVAQSRDDPAALARVVAEVAGAKLILLGGGGLAFVVLVALVPALRAHWDLHLLLFGTVAGQALLPLWLWRGLERTSVVAAVNAIARLAGLALTVALIEGPGDAVAYGGILAAQAIGAGLVTAALARTHLPRVAAVLDRGAARAALARAWPLFLSSLASSLTTSANPFLLGLVAAYGQVGLYGGAERVMFGAVSLLAPIAMAAFPRASSLAATDRGAALIQARRLLVATVGLGVVLAVALVLGAEPIARVYLGPEFAPAADVVRALAPVVPCLAAISVLGNQVMVAFGRDAAYRNVMAIGAGTHLALAALLAPGLGALGMALAFAGSSAVTVVLIAAYLRRAGLLPGTRS
jgi:PST family polysaccharide transporter